MLWSGFRVPNHVRLAVLGSLYERNSATIRVSNAVFSFWCPLWIAYAEVVTEDAERIRTMIFIV